MLTRKLSKIDKKILKYFSFFSNETIAIGKIIAINDLVEFRMRSDKWRILNVYIILSCKEKQK